MNTTTEQRTIPCPSWCVLSPEQHDIDQVDGSALHYGKPIGRFAVSQGHTREGVPAEKVNASADLVNEFYTASDLRAFAAEALEAAEWLEAHS